MKELWKCVTEYEGIYEVSNCGKVRTVKGKTTYTERHGVRHWKQRELKQKTDRNGYKRVSLWKDGKESTTLVHRMVAQEFVNKTKERNLVNHINGLPGDNRHTNLEWCTYKENSQHALYTGLMTTAMPITLVNKETKKEDSFVSNARASVFLGKNAGYISNLKMKGKKENSEYYFKEVVN